MSVVVDWEFARADAGSVAGPTDEGFGELAWLTGRGPGTAASMLRDSGLQTQEQPFDFDEYDWWFRARIESSEVGSGELRFDGLATVAEGWFNGERLLASESMYASHRAPVVFDSLNQLVIVARSLRAHLTGRRPRPRWKTRLIRDQKLRWVRTTLLGRMPGWSPGPAPVGPWRPVHVRRPGEIAVTDWRPKTLFAGTDGEVTISCRIVGSEALESATVRVGDAEQALAIVSSADGFLATATVQVPSPELWFPHTHGDPAVYGVSLDVEADGDTHRFDLPSLGFRVVEPSSDEDRFRIVLNGIEVFARGACWTPPDPVRMWADEPDLRAAISQVVDAGMNMIRIPGTTVYEQPDFHRLCDELGVMVWQDFMFANMQYPIDDPTFRAAVEHEARDVASRLASHPSTVVLCGGSEVEQQAAMMGASAEATGGHELGRVLLAEVAADEAPDIAYAPDSPFGGPWPFSVSVGVAHYFGVGGYLRPLSDARHAGVGFASECLAIANVPDQSTLDRTISAAAPHSPEWKSGVPRDGGAGWDFDDVRDHYLGEVFGIDPLEVRYADPARYLELSRATSYVVIERTITEWRRKENRCSGAVVLQLRDVMSGAGWGLIDATGRPKSAFYGMLAACRPITVLLSDDGLDGLNATVHNDRPKSFEGSLEVRLFGIDSHAPYVASTAIHVEAHSSCRYSIDGMPETFSDLTEAYRFGPPRVDVVSVALLDSLGGRIADAHHLPGGNARIQIHRPAFTVEGAARDELVELQITAAEFAQFVSIDLDGYVAEDNWFHLEPGGVRTVRCRPLRKVEGPTRGEVKPINSATGVQVRISR